MAAFTRTSSICSRLLRMARENKVERVFIHCFMDGRDTPPDSGIDFIRQLDHKLREYGVGQIATVSGRYYAMDRDNRWERVGTRLSRRRSRAEPKPDSPIRSPPFAPTTKKASPTNSSSPR